MSPTTRENGRRRFLTISLSKRFRDLEDFQSLFVQKARLEQMLPLLRGLLSRLGVEANA